MDRKTFLLTSALTAVGITAFGNVFRKENGEFASDCETTNDILGPFYRPDAPLRNDLTYEGLDGNRILVKGKVYTDDCSIVIENALVEIWHANKEGEYDNETDEFMQRAAWKTDEDGNYSFNTIFPGKYLNGKLYRPAHIHFRVSADGHNELISQIYFTGDPHIAKDPWASKKAAQERILPLIPEDQKGNLVVYFDIFLKKE